MSSVTASTFGGVDFDQLCKGDIQSYSFNPVDLTGERDVKQIEQKLIQRLEDTVRDLELHSDRRIAKYYIGKTFVKRKRKHGGGYQVFNSSDHRTWKKTGISSRWRDHRKEDYGRDGLVVLGVLTRQSLPRGCPNQIHQEDLALAMEQKLLHHFLLSKLDSRVVNDTFTTGKLDHGSSFAYAVYMAFSYEDSSTSADAVEEGNSPQDDVYSPMQTRAQCQSNPTHSHSSNVDLESHQSASSITPASPHSTTSSGASSDCIITAQFSGTQSDPRSRRRPANTPTSIHHPHPHQQVANTPSHTSPRPHSPPTLSPPPPKRKNI